LSIRLQSIALAASIIATRGGVPNKYVKVYQGRHRVTRKLVALKTINWHAKERLPPEVSLSIMLKHDNIADVIGYERNTDGTKLRLVMECMPSDLDRYIARKHAEGGHPPKTIKSFMHQLLTGIAFCHEHGVLHRDLKPANLLVRGGRQLKIGDFGCAMSLRECQEPLYPGFYYGTLWYRAPELLLGAPTYDMAVDVWSAGCIMAEMCSGIALFPGDSEEDELRCIFGILGTPTEQQWPGLGRFRRYDPYWKVHNPQPLAEILPRLEPFAVDLLRCMLQLRPEDRISAAEALEHSWFADLKRGRKRRK
jgi:non-specific serine/threonine protein kinase